MNETQADSISGPRGRWAALALLLAAIGAQLLVTDVRGLLNRTVWFDEAITCTLASDPRLSHSFEALADGMDGQPPAMHLVLRAVTMIIGRSDPGTIRAVSLTCMALAMAGLYLVLSQSFSPLVSTTATLAVWAHSMSVTYAFEARPYAMWTACVVWLCVLLPLRPSGGGRFARALLLSLLAIVICTSHYFGIITLSLAIGGQMLFERRGWREWIPEVVAFLLGATALALCLPLLAAHQKVMTGPGWVASPDSASVMDFITTVFPFTKLGFCCMALWASQLARDAGWIAPPESRAEHRVRLAGLSALLVLPALLVAFSYFVRPVTVPRYAIVAIAALGPLYAMILQQCHRAAVVAFALFALAMGVHQLHGFQKDAAHRQELIVNSVAVMREKTRELPLVFCNALDYFAVVFYDPSLAARAWFLDFEADELPDSTPHRRAERVAGRDLIRVFARNYPVVQTMSFAEVRARPEVVLVTGGGDPPDEAQRIGRTPRRLANQLHLLSAGESP